MTVVASTTEPQEAGMLSRLLVQVPRVEAYLTGTGAVATPPSPKPYAVRNPSRKLNANRSTTSQAICSPRCSWGGCIKNLVGCRRLLNWRWPEFRASSGAPRETRPRLTGKEDGSGKSAPQR